MPSLALVPILTVVVSAAISAVQSTFHGLTPFNGFFFHGLNVVVSLTIITLMVGALVTTALLTVGKMLIGLYLGRSGIASFYGAAGSVIVVMLWIYCSAEIFLLGAKFTSLYAQHRAAVRRSRDGSAPPSGPGLAGLRPPLPPEH